MYTTATDEGKYEKINNTNIFKDQRPKTTLYLRRENVDTHLRWVWWTDGSAVNIVIKLSQCINICTQTEWESRKISRLWDRRRRGTETNGQRQPVRGGEGAKTLNAWDVSSEAAARWRHEKSRLPSSCTQTPAHTLDPQTRLVVIGGPTK